MILGILILLGLLYYFNFSKNDSLFQNSNNSALRILQERYVKGEISDEEYLQKRENLLENRRF